jgi:hypothetical protein
MESIHAGDVSMVAPWTRIVGAATLRRRTLNEADVQTLRNHGFDDRDILDIV